MVSVDGLAERFIQPMIDEGRLPAFAKLQKDGAWTHDARSDYFNTTTIPNHTSMITGLPVEHTPGFPEDAHHGYTLNVLPPATATLHNLGNPEIDYIPSVFDVAHDFGLRTCFFASKTKFVIYTRSYNAVYGRRDTIGKDNGKAKIDVVNVEKETDKLVEAFERTQRADPCNLAFVHLLDTDLVGHMNGWGSPAWKRTLEQMDRAIGRIASLIETHPRMAGKTALLVTADHGGMGTGHGDATRKENFAVPFYVLGPNIPRGRDLYALVSKTRFPPGDRNPSYASPRQPIRNGDISNLALGLLGLPAIPGSVIFGMNLRTEKSSL